MARYNTSSATSTINGTATISSPFQGAFTQFTGIAPYTVTLPAPAAFPGVNQTFYNATGGQVTISTPSGSFTGTGGPNASTFIVNSGNVLTVVPDGTNYIVISEDGSPLVATTGAFSSDVSITGGITNLTPTSFSLTPGGSGGNINNVGIGATTRSTGAFTTLAANQAVTFTANTASSNTTTGTLVVTGGVGVSGTVTAATVNATNLGGTLTTAAQTNITSVGTLIGVTSTGDITVSDTSKGFKWGGSYVISPGGNHVPQATGFLSATGSVNFPVGWYRIARSAITAGSQGARGGAKITIASTGSYLGPLQDVVYLFKDWTTTGQIGRVENYIGSYFSRYRLAMDANYAYLEGYLVSGLTLVGTSGWQCTAEPYSGNWNADNWTVANETLTAGLASPVAQYVIPVSSGGTTLRRLLIDREVEASGASSPSLEVRVNGGISNGNYDGLFFTQGVDGTTPLGSFRLANKSSGAPDFELWTRSGSSETQRFIFTNAGRLGIGVSPTAHLHVVNSGTEATLSVTNNSSTGYAFGIAKLGETYSASGTSTVTPYEVAGTLGNFVSLPNSVNTGAILTFNAYNSSNGATGAYAGAVAGPTGNGPASFVIGRRTGTSTFAESVRVDTGGDTSFYGRVNTNSQANIAGSSKLCFFSYGTYGGNGYVHFKTNLRNTNAQMYVIEAKGYAYGSSQAIGGHWCGYVYSPSPSAPISTSVNNYGNASFCYSQYYSSDGYLVLVANTAPYYTAATFNSHYTAQGIYDMVITAWSQSTATSGVY